MAERLVWHVGLPKTGTSYLQDVVWSNRELLAQRGVTMPGFGHRVHLWAALELSGEQNLERRHKAAPGAWGRMVEQIHAAEGTALLTHEFFAAATAEQAATGRAAFGDTEVHLVITARDAASMLRAGWQEYVKNGGEGTLEQIGQREEPNTFGWWTWDLAGVLDRWGTVVPPENVHILPVPPSGSSPDQHWRNFAQVLGVDPEVELPQGAVNASLDVVQIEALRRVNAHLADFHSSRDRGHWIRGLLAEKHLAAQESRRLALGDDLLAQCQVRTDRAWRMIQERGFQVVGDPAGLQTPSSARSGRLVDTVTVEEVNQATGRLVASLLGDVRELSDRLSRAELHPVDTRAQAPATGSDSTRVSVEEVEGSNLLGRARRLLGRG